MVVEYSDLPGVNAEAPTLEALIEKLPSVIEDLLEDESNGDAGVDVPIELIAHASTRVRVRAVA